MREKIRTLQVADSAALRTQITTHRKELAGWFGVINWMILMMYALSFFSLPGSGNEEIVDSDYNLYFILILAFSTVVLSLCFEKKLAVLSDIALCTTPAAIIITAVFSLLPIPIGIALYLVSPILMAPALVRRAFGVLYTAPNGKKLTSYISGFAISYIFYSIWLTIDLPKEIAFLFPALLAVPAWWGIRHTVKLSEIPAKSSFVFSWKLVVGLIGAALLLLWVATMNVFIFTSILTTGFQTSNWAISLLSYGLPGVSYLLYAIVSDKGHERTGLTISVMLFIFGIFIGLLSGGLHSLWIMPLMFAITVGGSYFEFLFLTLPVNFFNRTKRPLFVAPLGVVIELIFAALVWKPGFWVPEIFWYFGLPLLYSAAFSTVVFVILITFVFERYREKSLAAVLHTILSADKAQNNRIEPINSPEEIEVAERKSLEALALTPDEIEVALLLVDGKTRSEITRKLRLKSGEANNLIDSIKNKISGGVQNQAITTVVKQYRLTKREADMLPYLLNGMTNQQIAEDLFLAESTVKNHIYSLLNKLPVKTRQEVPSWLETVEMDAP